ncbi:hypothetical protein V8F33_007123 [Rhypophila sp. PSN 637]
MLAARSRLSSRLVRRAAAGRHGLLTCRWSVVSCVNTPRGRSHFSTEDGRQRGRFLTIAFTPEGYDKETIIDLTHRALASYGRDLGNSNAAVVLASKSLAHWLDDPAFLSYLLAPCHSSEQEMDVLAGVVDSIRAPRNPHDPPPSEGIAIMTGEEADELLPGLWEGNFATNPQHGQAENKASIEFRLPPLLSDPRKLQTTVPMANTLFANGRPNTMFAARLGASDLDTSQPAFTQFAYKTSQVIYPGRGPRYETIVSAPLVPITRQRQIVQGLGNILKQVEELGEIVPASRKLEIRIPEILKARSESELELKQRPLTVWAGIYPDEIVTGNELAGIDELVPEWAQRRYPVRLMPNGFGTSREVTASSAFRLLMPGLLAGGSHFRQVLSGGGGWGQKQGLLSLDPESRYSTEDHEDVESFIRSFKGEEAVGSGIVTPGSWVQYFVECAISDMPWRAQPERPFQEIRKYENLNETISLGVHDDAEEPPQYNKVRLSQDYFGVSTSTGLYIASPSKPKPPSNRPVITTKIAVPGTELLSYI